MQTVYWRVFLDVVGCSVQESGSSLRGKNVTSAGNNVFHCSSVLQLAAFYSVTFDILFLKTYVGY